MLVIIANLAELVYNIETLVAECKSVSYKNELPLNASQFLAKIVKSNIQGFGMILCAYPLSQVKPHYSKFWHEDGGTGERKWWIQTGEVMNKVSSS